MDLIGIRNGVAEDTTIFSIMGGTKVVYAGHGKVWNIGGEMLYIMRHGKTDWNGIHKLQGRTDIPLNDEGRRMAKAASKEYQDVHFDICFCSPLIRAKETAQLVLQGRDISVIYDDRFMEMSFGIYEGLRIPFKYRTAQSMCFSKTRLSTLL